MPKKAAARKAKSATVIGPGSLETAWGITGVKRTLTQAEPAAETEGQENAAQPQAQAKAKAASPRSGGVKKLRVTTNLSMSTIFNNSASTKALSLTPGAGAS